MRLSSYDLGFINMNFSVAGGVTLKCVCPRFSVRLSVCARFFVYADFVYTIFVYADFYAVFVYTKNFTLKRLSSFLCTLNFYA